MRKIQKIALLLTCVFAAAAMMLTACGGDPPEGATEDGLLAENDVVDFYFYYPENFKIDKNDSMISVFAEDNENIITDIESTDGSYIVNVNPNLSVTVFGIRGGEYGGISDYWDKACLPAYENMFTSMEVSAEEDLTVADSLAKKYDFNAEIAGMNFKFTQVILMRKGAVYTITYTASPDKYEKYVNVLDTAVRTLSFK